MDFRTLFFLVGLAFVLSIGKFCLSTLNIRGLFFSFMVCPISATASRLRGNWENHLKRRKNELIEAAHENGTKTRCA